MSAWIKMPARLKSDQDGIESFPPPPARGMNGNGWNQTKMGLKVQCHSHRQQGMRMVEIRPRWDWKIVCPIIKRHFSPPVEIRPRWDWKIVCPIIKRHFSPPVEIRPRWDWKFSNLLSYCCRRNRVEIRPRWDWKFSVLQINLTISTCWNQTKMGLKGTSYCVITLFLKLCWNQTKMGLKDATHFLLFSNWSLLKSDQDGIESFPHSHSSPHIPALKSDQDGIERRGVVKLFSPQSWVEIRPRWDWKVQECELWGDWWDVEIRPRWDWKAEKKAAGWSRSSSWNQTKMGLKVFIT